MTDQDPEPIVATEPSGASPAQVARILAALLELFDDGGIALNTRKDYRVARQLRGALVSAQVLVGDDTDEGGPSPGEPKVVATYRRVAPSEGAPLALRTKLTLIDNALKKRGWRRGGSDFRDRISSGTELRCPQRDEMLHRLEVGIEQVLVVECLSEIADNLRQVVEVVGRSLKKPWTLYVLDVGLDTSTASGCAAATMIVKIARFEDAYISDRTRRGLEAKRGRRVRPEVVARIFKLREQQKSLSEIGEILDRQWPPVYGGQRWYASTVRSVLKRYPPPSRDD